MPEVGLLPFETAVAARVGALPAVGAVVGLFVSIATGNEYVTHTTGLLITCKYLVGNQFLRISTANK